MIYNVLCRKRTGIFVTSSRGNRWGGGGARREREKRGEGVEGGG